MADLSSLKTDAGTIRDASQQNENTAFRIGSWLVDLIEFLTNTTIEAVMTSIVPSVTADGIVLTLNYQKDDGSTFSNTITLPLADATKAGLMSPQTLARIITIESRLAAKDTKDAEHDSAISKVQQDIVSINKTDNNQDSLIEDISQMSETALAEAALNKNQISNLQNDVSSLNSQTYSLQTNAVKARQDFEAKDAEHDNAIASIRQSLSNNVTLIEEATNTAETALASTQANASNLAKMQQDVSSFGADVSALQSNVVKARQDFEAKDTEHDNAIEDINAQLNNLSAHLVEYETHLKDFNEDVVGASSNDGNGALFPRVINLEKDLNDVKAEAITETFVLNFTIKDGTNTGTFTAEEYNAIRQAIEVGKLIIIAGAATRNTADSQAMAADYVVIRYATPHINDAGAVTLSIYELKFSATEYTTKAIHKTIS